MRSLKSSNFIKNIFGAKKIQQKFNAIPSKNFNLLVGKNSNKLKIKNHKKI